MYLKVSFSVCMRLQNWKNKGQRVATPNRDRLQKENDAFIENPTDGGTDKRVQDLDGNDRLDLISNGIPLSSLVYFDLAAINGGSENLAVDGSVTPVVFTVGPPASEIWYAYIYELVIQDGGNNTSDRYGGIAGGLTNGLVIDQTIDATDHEFVNIKNNSTIAINFSDSHLRGQGNSFISSSSYYLGLARLEKPVTLVGDNNDVIKVTVADDLTGIDIHEFGVKFFKEV